MGADMERFLLQWKDALSGRQPVAVATVFGSLGSRPREIGAKRPQEIAVAIVAELIAFAHGKLT